MKGGDCFCGSRRSAKVTNAAGRGTWARGGGETFPGGYIGRTSHKRKAGISEKTRGSGTAPSSRPNGFVDHLDAVIGGRGGTNKAGKKHRGGREKQREATESKRKAGIKLGENSLNLSTERNSSGRRKGGVISQERPSPASKESADGAA